MTAADVADSSASDRRRALTTLADTYDSHVHHLLRGLTDHVELALAYVGWATVVAHLERALTATQTQSIRCQFRARDFNKHVGDRGSTRTDWIEAVLGRTGVAGRNVTGREKSR